MVDYFDLTKRSNITIDPATATLKLAVLTDGNSITEWPFITFSGIPHLVSTSP